MAVGVALAFGGTASYAPGTPEAALQEFLQANLDGDRAAIEAMLEPSGAEQCQEELERFGFRASGLRFGLDDMRVEGDRAWATASKRYGSGGDPFDGPTRAVDERFELRRIDGEWKIVAATWPWDIDRCLEDVP